MQRPETVEERVKFAQEYEVARKRIHAFAAKWHTLDGAWGASVAHRLVVAGAVHEAAVKLVSAHDLPDFEKLLDIKSMLDDAEAAIAHLGAP